MMHMYKVSNSPPQWAHPLHQCLFHYLPQEYLENNAIKCLQVTALLQILQDLDSVAAMVDYNSRNTTYCVHDVYF